MENSLAGLEAAVRLGCRAVEFDVMLTADRVPILMHDETLERTTRCTGRVAAQTLAQIRACDPDVPTLAEALAFCRSQDVWTNIELKPAAGHEAETGTVVGQWLATHWDSKGVISSFSQKSVLAGRNELPTAAFALLCDTLPADWTTQLARLDAVAVHLDAERVAAEDADRLREAGIPWAAWTVNDRATAERLFELGAAGIFTDRPDLWTTREAR